ncbi:ATP-binding protein [Streptomyces sp. NPDC002520]
MTQHQITHESGTPARQLSLRFSSTRRGARLARQLAVQQFTEWTGLPHDSHTARAVALVTAELAANAITHGSLPGRDFRLTLLLLPAPTVRIEVTDTRPDRLPRHPAADPAPPADAASGRGLLLVEAYTERWGCVRHDPWTKIVWADVPVAESTLVN